MPNPYFRFKEFTVYHDRCTLKVTTDACLFGAWCAAEIQASDYEIQSLLDIGTGSGLLPLMIAQKNAFLQISGVEIDLDSWQQGSENILQTQWKNRIAITHADVKKCHFVKRYDSIISNPPFYENELSSADAGKNTALHSAELSLVELLHLIKNNLAPAGTFLLLLPYKREKEINSLLQQQQLFVHKKVLVRPSVRHGFFRMFLKGGLLPVAAQTEELSIWDEQQQYTDAFTKLLKDYYLYL